MDASYGNQGDTTAVSFPEFLVNSQALILNFDYHMYGEDVGSLLMQVCMKFSFLSVPVKQLLSPNKKKYQLFVHKLTTILFQVFDITSNTKRHLWTKSGSQWNSWASSCVSLSEFSGRTVEISFIAVRGPGPLGDIAIDNIQLSPSCPCRLFFFQNLFLEMIKSFMHYFVKLERLAVIYTSFCQCFGFLAHLN